MKTQSAVIAYLLSFIFVSNAAFASMTNETQSTKESSRVNHLREKHLALEIKKLVIRKNITEKYAESSGNAVLSHTVKTLGELAIGAGAGAIAGVIITMVDGYYLGERHRLGKDLTPSQINRMVDYFSSKNRMNRTEIIATWIGYTTALVTSDVIWTEQAQLRKLENMTAEQISEEYQSILNKLKMAEAQLAAIGVK